LATISLLLQRIFLEDHDQGGDEQEEFVTNITIHDTEQERESHQGEQARISFLFEVGVKSDLMSTFILVFNFKFDFPFGKNTSSIVRNP
jgi:hypothetical protein